LRMCGRHLLHMRGCGLIHGPAASPQDFVVATVMYYLAEYILRIKYSNPNILEPLLSIAKGRLPSIASERSLAFAHEQPILLHRCAAADRYKRATAIRYKRVAAAPQEFVVATEMYYLADYMLHIIRPDPIIQDPLLFIAQARLPTIAQVRPPLLHRREATDGYTRAAASVIKEWLLLHMSL
jgi:hypothetical protein